MIFSMDKGKKLGKINLITKANFTKALNTVKEFINMRMDQFITENGLKIRFKDLVNIHGQIRKLTQENGKIIICMDKVYFLGLMVENMTVIILMIKNMVMVYIHGRMVVTTKENGKTVNKMERDFLKILIMKNEKDTGKMVNGLNG